jgi:hypothetical protein
MIDRRIRVYEYLFVGKRNGLEVRSEPVEVLPRQSPQ